MNSGLDRAKYPLPVTFVEHGNRSLWERCKQFCLGGYLGRLDIFERKIEVVGKLPDDRTMLESLLKSGFLPTVFSTLAHELVHSQQAHDVGKRKGFVRQLLFASAAGAGLYIAAVAGGIAIGGAAGVAVGAAGLFIAGRLYGKAVSLLFNNRLKSFAHSTMCAELQAFESADMGAWSEMLDSYSTQDMRLASSDIFQQYIPRSEQPLVGGPTNKEILRAASKSSMFSLYLHCEAVKRYGELGEDLRALRLLGATPEEIGRYVETLHWSEEKQCFPEVRALLNEKRAEHGLADDAEFERTFEALQARSCLQAYSDQNTAKEIAAQELMKLRR